MNKCQCGKGDPLVLEIQSRMVIYGDMHTKYFYGVTTIRRRKNRYGMIKDEEGN